MAKGEHIVNRNIIRCIVALGLIYIQNLSVAASGIVPPDSLIPDGLEPGDNFYVVFVTSNTVNGAQSAATYQGLAATAAANNVDTAVLSWTTLYGHDDNSLVTTSAFADASAPIYNTNGDKVADNRAEFFSNSHDAPVQYDESGVSVGGSYVWTGYNFTGTRTGVGDDSLGGNDSLNDGCLAGRANATDHQMFASVLSGGAGCTGTSLGLYVVSELLLIQPEIVIDPPELSETSLTLRIGESAEIDIDGALSSYLTEIEGSQSVVSVSEEGDGLVVTALAEGSTSIRVYQVVGDSAYITIEVLPSQEEIQDQLERLTEGQDGNGLAVFLGGVKGSGDEHYYQNGVFYVGEAITIDFAITPVPEHVGEEAKIVLALRVAGQIFLADESGNWAPFDGLNLPAYREVTLQEDNLVALLGDSSSLQLQATDIGSYDLFIGYELSATGELIYEPQSLQFEVVEQ